MIKHTLSADEFAAAYKGSIPYTRKKRPPPGAASKKTKAQAGPKTRKATTNLGLGLLAHTAMVVPVVLLALAILAASVAPSAVQHLVARGVLPAGWPSTDHLTHMAAGVVLGGCFVAILVAALYYQPCGLRLPFILVRGQGGGAVGGVVAGKAGTGAGGWGYGAVTVALVEALREVCEGDDQVHVGGGGEAAEKEIAKHSRDMSFHKRSPPDVVVFPHSAEEVQGVVRAAFKANVPVVPRGAGSGLEGGAIPYQVRRERNRDIRIVCCPVSLCAVLLCAVCCVLCVVCCVCCVLCCCVLCCCVLCVVSLCAVLLCAVLLCAVYYC